MQLKITNPKVIRGESASGKTWMHEIVRTLDTVCRIFVLNRRHTLRRSCYGERHMLYLRYNTPEADRLRNPGGTFNSLYEKSTVVKIAEGIDIFEHETFGKFLATQLSGGAKILILAYPLSWLGDNCYEISM